MNRTSQTYGLLTLPMGVDTAAQRHRARMGFDIDMQTKGRLGKRQGRLHLGGNPCVVNGHFQTMRVMLEGVNFHDRTLSCVIERTLRPIYCAALCLPDERYGNLIRSGVLATQTDRKSVV